MFANQELRVGGHKTVHAGYLNGVYQIFGLYKLKKVTQICDDVLVFAVDLYLEFFGKYWKGIFIFIKDIIIAIIMIKVQVPSLYFDLKMKFFTSDFEDFLP